jgi:S-formylglutathione hydrolase FrmB
MRKLKLQVHFFLLAFLVAGSQVLAGTVDTASIYSAGMHKSIKCVVIKPDAYRKKQLHFPVVYLLHGYSNTYNTWIRKLPALKSYSDRMQMIIVCPDGGFSSWYFDSPVDSTYRYETHICTEVVGYIDQHYRTVADRDHRGITGLSMGGHGALYLSIKHPDLFGVAGSMSGGVDLRPFPDQWDIALRIGDPGTHSKEWHDRSVVNMIGPAPEQPVAMMIECGTDDFFTMINRQLHEKLLELKIPHDYVERPGAHTWEYWTNAVEYQLLFCKKFFELSN